MKYLIIFLTISIYTFAKCNDDAQFSPILENWQIVILVERKDNGEPIFTFLKNSGNHKITNENSEQWREYFRNELKALAKKENSIIYAVSFENNKKSSRTSVISANALRDFKGILNMFKDSNRELERRVEEQKNHTFPDK